jgi:hypothetical protein
MISIVGFGRPKFGGASGKSEEKYSAPTTPNKTAKKAKICSECGQEIKK